MKDDIEEYWATYPMTAIRGKGNTGACAHQYALHTDTLCVRARADVFVRERCSFRLFHTWQMSKLHGIGRLHILGINSCLYRVLKLTVLHRRGLNYSNCWSVQAFYAINLLYRET